MHSGVGARYLSISHTERLAEAGAGAVTPSQALVGMGSQRQLITETIIGLLRVTEVIRKRGPWKTPGEVGIRDAGMSRLAQITISVGAGERSVTCHRRSRKRCCGRHLRPERRDSNKRVSTEPGAVHLGVRDLRGQAKLAP